MDNQMQTYSTSIKRLNVTKEHVREPSDIEIECIIISYKTILLTRNDKQQSAKYRS